MRMRDEIGKRLPDFLDGAVNFTTSAEVEAHLVTCVRCGMEFDSFARIKEALRGASRDRFSLQEDPFGVEQSRRFGKQLVGTDGPGRH